MRGLAVSLVLASTMWAGPGPEQLAGILNRVSEEAEAFRMLAPKVVGTEKLIERARKNPGRFHLRVGKDTVKPPEPKFRSRELISEYGFSTLADAPDALLELRQIVSVDGRPVTDAAKARISLTLGIRNNDEKAKRRMLSRFRKYGLRGAATDFGQVILLFRRRNLEKYDFQIVRKARLGAEEAVLVRFQQLSGGESFTVFEGRQATHGRIEGELWVSASDFVPLRIRMSTRVARGKDMMTHEGTVDYYRSAFGTVLPAAIRYRQFVEGELLVDNRSSYSNYRMFVVDSEVKFTPAEEPIENSRVPKVKKP